MQLKTKCIRKSTYRDGKKLWKMTNIIMWKPKTMPKNCSFCAKKENRKEKTVTMWNEEKRKSFHLRCGEERNWKNWQIRLQINNQQDDNRWQQQCLCVIHIKSKNLSVHIFSCSVLSSDLLIAAPLLAWFRYRCLPLIKELLLFNIAKCSFQMFGVFSPMSLLSKSSSR